MDTRRELIQMATTLTLAVLGDDDSSRSVTSGTAVPITTMESL
ncbi:MAG TPA: hypothetical protein VLA29_13060 [Acidimicrobiia bacterium]|nr:hypothetical protein [Acidimicrobiia bacterium]